jgi:predicted  nucleic acid-binding Zn-ribbon protein
VRQDTANIVEVKSNIKNLQTAIEKLEPKMTAIGQSEAKFEALFIRVEADVKTINTAVAEVKITMASIDSVVKAANGRIDVIERRLNNCSECSKTN